MAIAGINEKVKAVIPGETKREQVIEIFGKPDQYAWDSEVFSETELARVPFKDDLTLVAARAVHEP